jgi:DNA-nicking Smr family endonuclease
MPTAAQALNRLDRELEQARLEGCRVLTLIHGYGSTGRGGVIREEIRAKLQYLKYKGKINDAVTGEDFSTGTGPGRNLLRRFSFLRQHSDLNKGNRGVTLVIV